jgi:cysteinyl-tRNA synthetase
MLTFFNTLSGEREQFRPLEPGRVKLYTCGPTVYNFAHIGNHRAYIFEDLLKRALVFSGFRVTHVMNITDVDDKTIKGANAEGATLAAYTDRFIRAFFEDLKTLRISPADHYPRATEHIADMVTLIQILLDKGVAYRKDGSIYFRVAAFPAYGRLAKIDPAGLRMTGRVAGRIESDEYGKEHIQDFALWKAPKEGEPFWETEIGPGRPGWHIECSAMSSRYLGPAFDIHCGGVDNIFPHHENEIAQSEAATGKPFVRYWLHCHHLVMDGEKMSKSKGNVYTLRDLAARGVDPAALRFLLLSTHYRKVLNFTFDALEQAGSAVGRIKDFLYELENGRFPEGAAPGFDGLVSDCRARFAEGLADDLNISTAMTALFEFIKKANLLIKAGNFRADDANTASALVYSLDDVLTVLPPRGIRALPDDLQAKVRAREEARRLRDFRRADELRTELMDAGVVLEDTKDGVRWKITKPTG